MCASGGKFEIFGSGHIWLEPREDEIALTVTTIEAPDFECETFIVEALILKVPSQSASERMYTLILIGLQAHDVGGCRVYIVVHPASPRVGG